MANFLYKMPLPLVRVWHLLLGKWNTVVYMYRLYDWWYFFFIIVSFKKLYAKWSTILIKGGVLMTDWQCERNFRENRIILVSIRVYCLLVPLEVYLEQWSSICGSTGPCFLLKMSTISELETNFVGKNRKLLFSTRPNKI